MIKFKEWLAANAKDVIFTVAIGALAVGFWMAWPPLGLIVPSTIVLGISILSDFRAGG